MIVLVGGFPGSGKTFFAKQLATRLHAHHLSSDQWRRQQNASGKYSMEDKLRVYEQLALHAEELIHESSKTIIVDATFSYQTMRDIFYSLAEKLSQPIYFIWVYAKEELIRKRLQRPRMDSEADYTVFKTISKHFEAITSPFFSIESTDDNIGHMLAEAERYLSGK